MIMAAVCLLAFLVLFGAIVNSTDSACNVNCTTDYIATLNCSVSAAEGPAACDVEVICSDELQYVNGSCVIRPPHQWCTMQPEDFFSITDPDTTCNITANKVHQKNVMLYEIIKPQPPVNLTLTKSSKSFFLSWVMIYKEERYASLLIELMYSVRLRLKDDPNKKFKEYIVRDDISYLEIPFSLILPGRAYIFDVRASVNPELMTNSGKEWSEWSFSVEDSSPVSNQIVSLLLGLMALLLVVSIVLLYIFGKRDWAKKLRLLDYIPNPHDFFKPLYNTYEGDFKKWVGPVFTFNNFDVLEKNLPLQVLSDKQLASMPLQRELTQEPGGGSGGSHLGDWSLLSLVNPNSSKRYFLGGGSLGTSHSGGLISMDTVTVSGQEGSMLDWTGGSVGTCRHLEEGVGANRRAAVVGGEDVANFPQGFDDWQLRANDEDHISLNSYNSAEQSDYGYPQMGLDLDTIDSGFLESDCSSPVNSECDGGERMDAALLGGGVVAHSNYVKQWVAVLPMTENRSNAEQ